MAQRTLTDDLIYDWNRVEGPELPLAKAPLLKDETSKVGPMGGKLTWFSGSNNTAANPPTNWWSGSSPAPSAPTACSRKPNCWRYARKAGLGPYFSQPGVSFP